MGALWYPDDRSKPFIPRKFNKDLIATSRPADGWEWGNHPTITIFLGLKT